MEKNHWQLKDEWQVEKLRDFSAIAFGNVHRLGVALAILRVAAQEPERLYKEELARCVGVEGTEVGKHLHDFSKLGLVVAVGQAQPVPGEKRGRGRPPTLFRVTSDEFWKCLQELGDRFRRPPPSTRPGGPSQGANGPNSQSTWSA